MNELERHIGIFDRMIDKFGTFVGYKRYISTSYQDPVRRINPVKVYSDSENIPCFASIYKSISNEQFVEGDIEIKISSSFGVVPSIEDKIIYEDNNYSIVQVYQSKIANGVVFYKLKARVGK